MGARVDRLDSRRPVRGETHHRSDRRQDRHEGARHRRHRAHGIAISAARRGARARSRSRRFVRGRGARRHALLVELSRLLRRARQSRASRIGGRRARGGRGRGRHRKPAPHGLGARRLRALGRVRRNERTSPARRAAAPVHAGCSGRGPCARRVPRGDPGHEAVPRRRLDRRRILFPLADRSLLVARRELRRVRRRARARRACRRGGRASSSAGSSMRGTGRGRSFMPSARS